METNVVAWIYTEHAEAGFFSKQESQAILSGFYGDQWERGSHQEDQLLCCACAGVHITDTGGTLMWANLIQL